MALAPETHRTMTRKRFGRTFLRAPGGGARAIQHADETARPIGGCSPKAGCEVPRNGIDRLEIRAEDLGAMPSRSLSNKAVQEIGGRRSRTVDLVRSSSLAGSG